MCSDVRVPDPLRNWRALPRFVKTAIFATRFFRSVETFRDGVP
jgi:hypothetical protein